MSFKHMGKEHRKPYHSMSFDNIDVARSFAKSIVTKLNGVSSCTT